MIIMDVVGQDRAIRDIRIVEKVIGVCRHAMRKGQRA